MSKFKDNFSSESFYPDSNYYLDQDNNPKEDSIPELEYFYSEMVKISIIEKCPTKINCKCSYNKSSILKPMRSRLIYTIFIKIRITHLKDWISYPSK